MAKLSPLAEIHAELDAKMIPLAGWTVPANYPGGTVAEHKHTRKFCSIFDASWCGKFRIAGTGCLTALAAFMPEDILKLAVGECMDTFIFAENGTLIDAVSVLRMAEEDCFITANAENTAKVLTRMQEKLPEEIIVQDLTDPVSRIILAGPAAKNVLLEAGAEERELPAANHCGMVEITDIRCIISARGLGGEQGFDLFCSADNAIDLWDELTCIEPVRPAGAAAADSLRTEAGIPVFGREYTADLISSDLPGNGTCSTAGCTFILLQIQGKISARSGDKIYSSTGEEIGIVTSASQAPSLPFPCAICRVAAPFKPACGDKIIIKNSSAELTGVVVPELYTSINS